jgi:hypothetical protein
MSNAKKVKRPNIHTQRVQIADRYFAQHPSATQFERDVTPAESRVLGLAPGTKVGVDRKQTTIDGVRGTYYLGVIKNVS